MIQVITRDNIETCRDIVTKMYSARANIFKYRLGWDVSVADGLEIDVYDRNHDPVYIIAKGDDGELTGSLRLLPTIGDTMLREDFRTFFDPEVDIMSPTVWECTRFCVHPNVGAAESRLVATELLLGLCKLARVSGVEHIVGVYEASMLGVYRRIGWSPETLARSRPVFGKLMVGLWSVNEANEAALKRRLNVMHSTSLQGRSSRHPTIPVVNVPPYPDVVRGCQGSDTTRPRADEVAAFGGRRR